MAYYADLEKKINALTPADVLAALKKYIDPKKLVVVDAGDFAADTRGGEVTGGAIRTVEKSEVLCHMRDEARLSRRESSLVASVSRTASIVAVAELPQGLERRRCPPHWTGSGCGPAGGSECAVAARRLASISDGGRPCDSLPNTSTSPAANRASR